MNFARFLISLICALFSISALSTPVVAPFSRWSLFTDGNNPAWVNSYTTMSTTYLGTMKFLKHSSAVQTTLVSNLNMTNKYTSTKTWNGGTYQQISENGTGYQGQCVGFVKAMTGVGATSTWTKTASNALSAIFPNGNVGSTSAEILLPPGAMLVNFNGGSTYGNTIYNHTLIVLSPVVSNGKIIGANVVSQNAAETAGGIPNANLMISKYFLPWDNTSSRTSFALKNYHLISQ